MKPGLHFFEDADGEWRWHAVSSNSRIVATGAEGYRNRADCVHGAEIAQSILLVNLLRMAPQGTPGEALAETLAQVAATEDVPQGTTFETTDMSGKVIRVEVD